MALKRFGSVVLIGWLFAACGRTDNGSLSHAGPAASRALGEPGFDWRVVNLPETRLRLFVQRESYADSARRTLADSVERAARDVLGLLDLEARADSVPESAVFIVASRDAMQQLAGRPLAGFVQPGEPTAFFIWPRGYRPPIRHELAHLYTFELWDRPVAGDSAAWLVEGIGAFAGGACLGSSSHALAAGLLARNELPTVDQLVSDFRSLREDVGMPAAGSLVEFIHATEGVEGLRRRWESAPDVATPDASLEAAWRTHLAAVAPATLDVARVIAEGC